MAQDNHNILHHWREAVPDDRMTHLIRDTERAFRRALQLRLAAHGVPIEHWAFLRILWEADGQGGLTQKELSNRAGVMEALGHISRKQLPSNKKNVYVELTDTGRDLKHVLMPLAVDTNQVSVKGLTAADIATARRVLPAMLTNLSEARM